VARLPDAAGLTDHDLAVARGEAEPVFAAVRAQFDTREVVELTATVAAYNMVSRVLVALDVRP